MAASADELQLGSGRHGMQLASVYCASSTTSNGPCTNLGNKFCKNCKLVAYCSRECQALHWKVHRILCKSELMHTSWSPCWLRESRPPSFIDRNDHFDSLAPMTSPRPLHEERLWGNIPAYGVLGCVESLALPNHLRICFAASRDLRNVIETVCQIPDDFKGEATFYVNDANAKVMVRNFLILELLRVHGLQAIDAVIALWYSVALTSEQLKAMKFITKQVQRWASEQASTEVYEYSGPVKLAESHVIARFRKESLQILRLLCENGMSLERAKETRMAVVRGRPDLVDRRMACLRPVHRLAWWHFRETGILLPFASQSCAEIDLCHVKANRFLLTPILGWTLWDGSDPLDGWDIKQVLSAGVRYGVSLNDLYGCLFFHLRAKLQTFLNKWQQCRISFVLSDVDASKLADDFRRRKVSMHRIDTSNLADAHVKGIQSVLSDWGPLLASKSTSSASTSMSVDAKCPRTVEPLLITYFMNWALFYNRLKSCTTEDGAHHFVDPATTAAEISKAVCKGMQWGTMHPGFKELVMQMIAGGNGKWYTYFHDFSKAFNEYLGSMQGALQAAEMAGVQRKQMHAVVPHRLSVGVNASTSTTPAMQGNLEDFYCCNVLQFNTMTERFVEWTKL